MCRRRAPAGRARTDCGAQRPERAHASEAVTYGARMRAAVMREWQLRVDDIADPVPGPGQALTKVLACGICGSDLHLLQHGEESLALRDELAAENPPGPLDP